MRTFDFVETVTGKYQGKRFTFLGRLAKNQLLQIL